MEVSVVLPLKAIAAMTKLFIEIINSGREDQIARRAAAFRNSVDI